MEHGTQHPNPPTTPIQVAAERIITLAADHLRHHPHPTHCMNEHLLDDALRRAQDTVLSPVRPRSSHDLIRAAVRAMLLPAAGTIGEYADRLAEMAVSG